MTSITLHFKRSCDALRFPYDLEIYGDGKIKYFADIRKNKARLFDKNTDPLLKVKKKSPYFLGLFPLKERFLPPRIKNNAVCVEDKKASFTFFECVGKTGPSYYAIISQRDEEYKEIFRVELRHKDGYTSMRLLDRKVAFAVARINDDTSQKVVASLRVSQDHEKYQKYLSAFVLYYLSLKGRWNP